MDSNSTSTLQEFHWKVLLEHLPVIIILGILATAGVVGNILTLVYYHTKGTHKTVNFLISSLAVVDLSVCLLLFVATLEIGYNVMYSSGVLCQTMYFAFYTLIYSSILTLSLICIDRYRKICKPFKSQMTLNFAKRSVVVIAIVASFISSRTYVTYDVIEVGVRNTFNDTIKCYQCETSNDPDLELTVEFFHYFDIVNVGGIFVIFIVTYSLIIRGLYMHQQKLKATGKEFELTRFIKKGSLGTANKQGCETSYSGNITDSSPTGDSKHIENYQNGTKKAYRTVSKGLLKIIKSGFTIRTDGNTVNETGGQVKKNNVQNYANTVTQSKCQPLSMNSNESLFSVNCGNKTDIAKSTTSVVLRPQEMCSVKSNNPVEESFEHSSKNIDGKREVRVIDWTSHQSTNVTTVTETKQFVGSSESFHERIISLHKTEIQITVMMIVVTMWFVASFTPYFASIDVANEFPISSSTHFVQKCPFLNSVMNPIIYYFFNRDFRRFINNLCKRRG